MTPALARTGPGYGRGDVPRIRLMIVDDSMVARAVLTRMLEADGGFEIVAVAVVVLPSTFVSHFEVSSL